MHYFDKNIWKYQNKSYLCFQIREDAHRNNLPKFNSKHFNAMETTITGVYKNYLKWKNDEFRSLRRFIIMQQSQLSAIGLGSMMDVMDEVRELNTGEILYCVPSQNEVYRRKSVEELQECGNMMDKSADRNAGLECYRPMWSYSFCIKRTEKGWIFRFLEYCY